jgi:hypothetical protein
MTIGNQTLIKLHRMDEVWHDAYHGTSVGARARRGDPLQPAYSTRVFATAQPIGVEKIAYSADLLRPGDVALGGDRIGVVKGHIDVSEGVPRRNKYDGKIEIFNPKKASARGKHQQRSLSRALSRVCFSASPQYVFTSPSPIYAGLEVYSKSMRDLRDDEDNTVFHARFMLHVKQRPKSYRIGQHTIDVLHCSVSQCVLAGFHADRGAQKAACMGDEIAPIDHRFNDNELERCDARRSAGVPAADTSAAWQIHRGARGYCHL